MTAQPMQSPVGPASLAPGTLVSGRFEIETYATAVGPVGVWNARDRKVARTAALWMVSNHGLTPDQLEAARRMIRAASSLSHKDLVAVYGSAITSDGALCVATEPVPPTSLAEVLDRKRQEGAVFSLSQAFPYVAHLAEILQGPVHPGAAHGAIAPATVRFEGSHLRLAGVGMFLPLYAAGVIPAHCVAPELRAGAEPTPQSDVYAVGALLYELLTGHPADPNVPVSSLAQGAPASLDVLVESCLADDPADRLESVAALRGGLASILGPAAEILRDEEIDIPIEFSERPPTMADYTLPPGAFDDDDDDGDDARPQTLPPGLLVDSNTIAPGAVAIRPSAPMPARPSTPRLSTPRQSVPQQAHGDDLGSLLKAATKNDSDRWMFSHEGLDHGPMTARDLIASVVRGELLPGDLVTNMDTSERRALTAWPQYREFAETAAEKRKVEARKAATVVALADTSVARTSKMIIAAVTIVVLGAVGVVFYKTLGAGANRARSAAEIDQLVARGELRVQTQTVQLLPPPPPSAHRGGGGGGGHGGFTSYEAAMNIPIEYNMNGGAGGGGTLNDSEISRPLNASLGRFAGCLSDGSARNVTLRLVIGGNGRAMGVTVQNGSPGLKSCVAGVVRSLSWRAFGGPRLGLSWGFGF